MTAIPEELTTRPALQKWLERLHEASKTLDARVFSMCFTQDAELQFANNPIARGRDAIEQSFAFAFERLDVMTHDIVYFDYIAGPEPKLYQAADIRYVVKGDDPEKDEIRIPGILSCWLAMEDGDLRLKKAEIYLDASRVFARMAEKGLMG